MIDLFFEILIFQKNKMGGPIPPKDLLPMTAPRTKKNPTSGPKAPLRRRVSPPRVSPPRVSPPRVSPPRVSHQSGTYICGAETKSGGRCQHKSKNKEGCYLHGGLITPEVKALKKELWKQDFESSHDWKVYIHPILVEYNGNIRHIFNSDKKNLMEAAVYSARTETIELLIDKFHVDINVRGLMGKTPIMWARSVKMVDYLVDKGAAVNMVDDRGKSVLYHLRNISTDIIPHLVEDLGADPKINIKNIHSPLMIAYLLQRGAIDTLTQKQRTHLLIETQSKSRSKTRDESIWLTKYLIRTGADVKNSEVLQNVRLPFCVKLLCAAGADPNGSTQGYSFTTWAVSLKRSLVAYELLRCGADYGKIAIRTHTWWYLDRDEDWWDQRNTGDRTYYNNFMTSVLTKFGGLDGLAEAQKEWKNGLDAFKQKHLSNPGRNIKGI